MKYNWNIEAFLYGEFEKMYFGHSETDNNGMMDDTGESP